MNEAKKSQELKVIHHLEEKECQEPTEFGKKKDHPSFILTDYPTSTRQ